MPHVDFTPEGLDAQWPSRRWLDFLEGPPTGPFWGILLGHGSAEASLYIGTYPRCRFDAAMTPTGGDPVKEIAYSAAHQMINRILAATAVTGDRRSALVKLLTQYSARQSEDCRAWKTAEWTFHRAPSVKDEISASVISLASWQAAFAVAGDYYITAVGYGFALDSLAFSPVVDPTLYGFTSDAALPAAIPTAVPESSADDTLHPDLETMLA